MATINDLQRILEEIRETMEGMQYFISSMGLSELYSDFVNKRDSISKEVQMKIEEVKEEKQIPEAVQTLEYDEYEVSSNQAIIYLNAFLNPDEEHDVNRECSRFFYVDNANPGSIDEFTCFDMKTGERQVYQSRQEAVSWCEQARDISKGIEQVQMRR